MYIYQEYLLVLLEKIMNTSIEIYLKVDGMVFEITPYVYMLISKQFECNFFSVFSFLFKAYCTKLS